MRCELHKDGPLANQCTRSAVVYLQVLVGTDPGTAEFTAAACAEHAWEATALGGREVSRLRGLGADDARLIALLEEAGVELLDLLQNGITVGERWPLAKPWVRS